MKVPGYRVRKELWGEEERELGGDGAEKKTSVEGSRRTRTKSMQAE